MSVRFARPLWVSAVACCLSAAVPASVFAQVVQREAVPCAGQVITATEIDTRPPFPAAEGTFIARTGHAASKLHTTTRAETVRRYLALDLGDRCEELRRAESERILRAQPFISDATIVVLSDGQGGVVLSVTTVDEISIVLGGSISASSPYFRSAKLGNRNFFGSGLHGEVRWEDGREFRDAFNVRITDYQFFGRPYQLMLEAGRLHMGMEWLVDASHPFLTDLQRIAWRVGAGELDTYTRFRRPGADPVHIAVDREYVEAGGVVRVGPIARFLLAGASITRERVLPGEEPVRVVGGEIVTDTSTVLIGRYIEQRQARANALLGVRFLRFMEVNGFDALDARQDVRKGLQLGLLLGRGFTFLDTKSDEDFFASASAYVGMGSPSAFTALELNVEGRRAGTEDNWNSVLSSGRLALFARPFLRHTTTASLEWSGGWRSRVPYQVTFASHDGGLRGYRSSQTGGARRLVLRAEDKYIWGRYKQYATVGIAAFVDAGRIWAGDSPYGVDTPVRYSAGVGLLVAAPPRSRRLARLDFAYPLNTDGKRRVEARVTVRDFGRVFWREPRDLYQARERSRPASVFTWP